MKLYFVATKDGSNDTELDIFTSQVKQQAAFKKKYKANKTNEEVNVFMFGPVDFGMNSKGIIEAVEFGIKAKGFKEEDFVEDDNA